jgi:hypothetical protein
VKYVPQDVVRLLMRERREAILGVDETDITVRAHWQTWTERESERERECVCVCVCEILYTYVHMCIHPGPSRQTETRDPIHARVCRHS